MVALGITRKNILKVKDNRVTHYLESGKKHTPQHNAAVIGDTVGDPLKDTSGPSLNILVKIMAILSLVFAGFFERTQVLTALISR